MNNNMAKIVKKSGDNKYKRGGFYRMEKILTFFVLLLPLKKFLKY